MESEINCSFCNKTFTEKKKLKIHCRKFHDTDIIPIIKYNIKHFQSEHCDDQFSSKKTFSVHTKNVHKIKNIDSKKRARIICPLDNCNEDLFKFDNLRKHLTQEHSFKIEYEEVNFRQVSGNDFIMMNGISYLLIFLYLFVPIVIVTISNITDFEKWKHIIEQQTLSVYVLNRAPALLRDGRIRKHYYCRHSFSRRPENDKINIKSTRSNRIGRVCPAMMKVTISESNSTPCTVQFWKTHYGHSQYIEQVQLDDFDNNDILHAEINSEDQENIMHINKPSVQYETITNSHNNFDIVGQTDIINALGTTRTYSDHQKYLINKHLTKVIKIMNKGNKVHLQPVNNINTQKKIKRKQRKKESQSKTLNKLINTILSGIEN